MKIKYHFYLVNLVLLAMFLPACQPGPTPPAGSPGLKVIAIENFLADIAQNVAGDRVRINSLIPAGLDPHAFEPIPQDVAVLSEANVVIANGAGFEGWLQEVMNNAGGNAVVLEASAGLQSRTAREGEKSIRDNHPEGDPHFWLDPLLVIHYVENIRDGLIRADPPGKETYTRNAETYISRLKELDRSIREQVSTLPPEKRLIVTNHESFGYFADRYGFTIIGTIIPSVSTASSSSAQQLARLVDNIRRTNASAIFLEAGTNPQMAELVAGETGIRVVTGLYTHSLTGPDGEAPTYMDMMTANTSAIVEALKTQ